MNAVDKLLKLDTNKIKVREKIVPLKLEKWDVTVDFTLKYIPHDIYDDIQNQIVDLDDMGMNINAAKATTLSIIEACPDIFKNDEVLKKFRANSPIELVNILLTKGEMDFLDKEINDLMGFGKNKKKEREEIKNLQRPTEK